MVTRKFFTELWASKHRQRQLAPAPSGPAQSATFDSPDYWGSTEEHEIQQILQRIISSSLDTNACKAAFLQLYEDLVTASDGWVERFSLCQGPLVCKKLLSDINSNDSYMQLRDLSEYAVETMEHELAIVKCLNVVFSRSNVARELVAKDKSQSVVHTLLRSALSPNERTRRIASATLERLKCLDSSSNLLQLLTARRCSSGSNKAGIELSECDLRISINPATSMQTVCHSDAESDWDTDRIFGPVLESGIHGPIKVNAEQFRS